MPEQTDYESLRNLQDHDLSDYHIILCVSLKELVDQNLENSEQAQTLYPFYKLTKSEIRRRSSMPSLPQTDAFLDYIQNKQAYQKQAKILARARKTGEICIFCSSKNVASHGSQWKCHTCGKKFNKH